MTKGVAAISIRITTVTVYSTAIGRFRNIALLPGTWTWGHFIYWIFLALAVCS